MKGMVNCSLLLIIAQYFHKCLIFKYLKVRNLEVRKSVTIIKYVIHYCLNINNQKLLFWKNNKCYYPKENL